jgi:hypothetical protein
MIEVYNLIKRFTAVFDQTAIRTVAGRVRNVGEAVSPALVLFFSCGTARLITIRCSRSYHLLYTE